MLVIGVSGRTVTTASLPARIEPIIIGLPLADGRTIGQPLADDAPIGAEKQRPAMSTDRQRRTPMATKDTGHDTAAGAQAVVAWAAYRRMLRITLLVAVLAAAGALAWLTAHGAPLRWELWAAVTGGVAGTVMLSGALMGLAFLSARSGHDASIDDPHDTAN